MFILRRACVITGELGQSLLDPAVSSLPSRDLLSSSLFFKKATRYGSPASDCSPICTRRTLRQSGWVSATCHATNAGCKCSLFEILPVLLPVCPVISLHSLSPSLVLIHFTAVKTLHERELTRSNRWRQPPTHIHTPVLGSATHTHTHDLTKPM